MVVREGQRFAVACNLRSGGGPWNSGTPDMVRGPAARRSTRWPADFKTRTPDRGNRKRGKADLSVLGDTGPHSRSGEINRKCLDSPNRTGTTATAAGPVKSTAHNFEKETGNHKTGFRGQGWDENGEV